MAIISQNTFDNYSYQWENNANSDLHNIQLSNAGYIALNDNNSHNEYSPSIGYYTKIDFGDDVTCIGANCCQSEQQLSSVSFSNKLVEIQEFAFDYCTSLVSVELPNSIRTLGPYCFSFCYDLTSINIPDKLTDIPYCCFNEAALKVINIPSNITCIQEKAFYLNWNVDNQVSLILNNGLKVIDDFAFGGASLTGNLSIPDTVEYIGSGAFANGFISSVNIPTNAKIPTGNPFWGNFYEPTLGIICADLSITLDIENATYLRKGGKYGIMNDNNKLVIPYNLSGEGGQIYSIGEYCFADNSGSYDLSSISFEEGCLSTVSAINDYAFLYSNIQSITFTDAIKNIGMGAFEFCMNLSNVVLPSSLTELQRDTFFGSKVTNITIPDTISSIGSGCFADVFDTSQKVIIFDGDYIGKTIPTITNDTFSKETKLSIYVSNSSVLTAFQNDPDWSKYITKIDIIPQTNDLLYATTWAIPDQTFTFEPITPNVVVEFYPIIVDNKYLDFQYLNNVDVGTATIIISAKPGSPYVGQTTRTFKIVPANINDGDATINE